MPKSPLQLARDKIHNINDYLAQDSHRVIKDRFLEKFMFCEIGYKELLKHYYKAIKKKYKEDDLKLNMHWVPKVIKHFNLSIDTQTLKQIFSTTDDYQKRNSKSARVLRNGIVHDMNIQDTKEVVNRQEHLFQVLDLFLSKIDEAATLIDATDAEDNSTAEHNADEELLAIG